MCRSSGAYFTYLIVTIALKWLFSKAKCLSLSDLFQITNPLSFGSGHLMTKQWTTTAELKTGFTSAKSMSTSVSISK